MGVVYKLKPEIKNYVLEQKKTNPILSCRGILSLVESKFQIKVSKSSINSMFKTAGLSMPVGRRRKKRRKPAPLPQELKLLQAPIVPQLKELQEVGVKISEEAKCSGAILLKAADYMIGGSHYFREAINNRLTQPETDLLIKTESLIYLSLFEQGKEAHIEELAGLWPLIDKKLSLENILLYLNELQSVRTITLDILRIIPIILQEVRCMKVSLSDGSIFYLDGQLHTVWSTPNIPYGFATTIYNIKSYINRYFYEGRPFVFFMAPGYDIPTNEFFNFILGLEAKEKRISKLTLYGNRFEEVDTISLEQTRKHFFVFGLWPWQYVEYRKVKKIGEFKPFCFETLNIEFYVADVEIELLQPNNNQSVTLKGAALKTNLSEKTRLLVLSNLTDEEAKPENLLNLYLSRWPNIEEAFQDFSRKIELFTYTGSSQRFFSADTLNLNRDFSADIRLLFREYLEALDLYARWHFFPPGYEDKDFPTINAQFYRLESVIKKQNNNIFVLFKPPEGFAFLPELKYTCRRLNEREITSPDKKRYWFLL